MKTPDKLTAPMVSFLQTLLQAGGSVTTQYARTHSETTTRIALLGRGFAIQIPPGHDGAGCWQRCGRRSRGAHRLAAGASMKDLRARVMDRVHAEEAVAGGVLVEGVGNCLALSDKYPDRTVVACMDQMSSRCPGCNEHHAPDAECEAPSTRMDSPEMMK